MYSNSSVKEKQTERMQSLINLLSYYQRETSSYQNLDVALAVCHRSLED